jgi:hypothetical protein
VPFFLTLNAEALNSVVSFFITTSVRLDTMVTEFNAPNEGCSNMESNFFSLLRGNTMMLLAVR